MNAIELLKEDHDRVDQLFQTFKADEDADHRDTFEQIKAELEVHTHIEETIFYPKIKADGDEELKKLILEGVEEHHQVKIFIRELSNLVEDSEKFQPKLKVLIEDVAHHVQEEEGKMFPMIKEQFDEYTLQMLGDEMEKEKKSYGKTTKKASAK